ncbi:MAG: hypothetical protein R3F31_28470 [Verrucomicrobiales bacterium]
MAVKDEEDGSGAAKAEFSVRTLVSSSWAAADGKLTDVDRAEPDEADRLFQLPCHRPEIGPPLIEIGKKYQGQAGALEASVNRVIKARRESGRWMPMLPTPSTLPTRCT